MGLHLGRQRGIGIDVGRTLTVFFKLLEEATK